MSFIVRRVEPDDYKNIVDMREDIYHGTDYIPDTFQKLVKHPDYKGYVAVDNDRFVSVYGNFQMVNSVAFLSFPMHYSIYTRVYIYRQRAVHWRQNSTQMCNVKVKGMTCI